jgi:hypothetical protein
VLAADARRARKLLRGPPRFALLRFARLPFARLRFASPFVSCLAAAFAALLIGGCASHPSYIRAGEDAAAARARVGPPFLVVPQAAGERWIYPTGPMGQQAYLVEVGGDGRIANVVPALTDERFGLIEKGKWNEARVMREFGPPAETGRLPLKKQHVWSYRYKQDRVWNSLMHVHFDSAGIVQEYFPTPDPLFDPDDRDFLRILR